MCLGFSDEPDYTFVVNGSTTCTVIYNYLAVCLFHCVLFCSLVVKYHGRASHASAYPWEGVNALDAAVVAYSNMSVLRQQLRPDWRVHGEFATLA